MCQLLELRRTAARASVNKFKRMLAYASPADDRMRGTLRMYGGAPGRWSGLGPQLQNLKKNESNLPLSVVDQVRAGDRTGIAQYGNPLSLLGDISRAALCAAEDMELKSGDFSAIESVVLAWLAGEQWKLNAYQDLPADRRHATRAVPCHRAQDAAQGGGRRDLARRSGSSARAANSAAGFGGIVSAPGVASCRTIRATDDEIKAIIQQWRDAHPATCKFWKDLPRAIRVAIRTGQPILVARHHSRRSSRRSPTAISP